MRVFIPVLVLACLVGVCARADVSHYSTGFESPTFTLGPLVGQDSWTQFNTDAGNVATLSVSGGISTDTTQVVKFQNLVSGQTNGDSSYGYRLLTPVTPLADGNPIIRVQWDMYVQNSATQSAEWGVEAYDTDTNLIAGVALATSGFLQGTSANANLGYAQLLGTAPTKNAWHTYVLAMDFSTGSYRVDVDSVLKGFGFLTTTNNHSLSDADFVANFRGLDTAYFDNFSVTSSTLGIPEPSAGLALGSAILLLARRGRRTNRPDLTA